MRELLRGHFPNHGAMIESGLFQFITSDDVITAAMGNSDPQRKAAFNACYFSFMPKAGNQVLPCIVMDRLRSPNADETLDAASGAAPTSLAPGQAIEGFFQFGSMAEDSQKNPIEFPGYLSAALLSQALRRQLLSLATGTGVLPDGTLIQDLRIDDEFDAHYELGGGSYLYRRILKVTIIFQEVA